MLKQVQHDGLFWGWRTCYRNSRAADKHRSLKPPNLHCLTDPRKQAQRSFKFGAIGSHKEGLADWAWVGKGFWFTQESKTARGQPQRRGGQPQRSLGVVAPVAVIEEVLILSHVYGHQRITNSRFYTNRRVIKPFSNFIYFLVVVVQRRFNEVTNRL